MALAVVGSIAFDSVTTPFGAVDRELGGSAVHAALAASFFTRVRAIGPVGDDFTSGHYEVLEGREVNTAGVQAIPGETFFWRGRYDFGMSAWTEETRLNAFDGWSPRLSRDARESSVLFLAAMDPHTQAEVRAQAPAAGCVALDSMTYWIRTERDALLEAIRGVDIVLMNDHEARELTGQPMLLAAARELMALGPRAVALRLGEYGCALLSPEGFFSIPGYPLEALVDPTGSGDAFAGGFLGYLDLVRGDWASEEVLRRAVTYGCVMASFCVEDFGSRRLLTLKKQEIDYRFRDFRDMTHFEHVPLHPRPRGVLDQQHDGPIERPQATGGTPVYQRVRPTATGARWRVPGLARVWNQPNAFRRASASPAPVAQKSFPTSESRGTFATASGLLREPGAATALDGGGSSEGMTYCVVPRDVSRKVTEAIGRMYADDPTVTVIVERREGDRRTASARRATWTSAAKRRIVERRRVRHGEGRRVAERRGVLVPSFGQMPLPRAARRYAQRIAFCGLIGPSPTWTDEVESVRLALAHQSGDTRAFETLYKRWFDRVFTFFKVIDGTPERAETALQLVFMSAFTGLGEFQPATTSFRSWFGRHILDQVPPSESDGEHEDGDARLLERWAGPPDMHALRWLQDSEILVLIGRLSSPQREVVALHYVLAMSPSQIADVLGCTPAEVNDLHDRALRFMSGCVTSLSRRPGYSGRHPMRARPRSGTVILSRKAALAA